MTYNLVGAIISFESGELGTLETIKLFSNLVKTGKAWSLQGSYGRGAQALIEQGILSADGTIDYSHEVLAPYDPSDTSGPEQDDDQGDPEFWCFDCEAEEPSLCVCGSQEIEIPPSEY